MIFLWIYLSYGLVTISGQRLAESVNSISDRNRLQEDFTFFLVHNLSEVKDWSVYSTQLGSTFSQKPQLQPTVEVAEPEDIPEPDLISTTHSLPSQTCGVRGRSQGFRIVGGTNAQPAEFPWQVSLQLTVGRRARHICGGAVLSSHWVVTAGHCVWELDPPTLSVVAGDYDLYTVEGHEQRSSVARVVVNNYGKDSFTNDIALLQLASPLNIDYRWISPICLPDPSHKFNKGDSIVSGWGRLSENGGLPHILQHVSLPILNLRRCHSFYKKAGYSKFTHNCQICSGYEQGALDSCQGDSGGPLVCKQTDGYYYLCGIVSWGVGCARPMFPGVYTELTCFVDWIKQIINNERNVLNNAPTVVSIASFKRPLREELEDSQLV